MIDLVKLVLIHYMPMNTEPSMSLGQKQVLKTIMIKGQGLQYVISEVLVMLTMTAVFIALSIKKFKVRLE